jgi:DNA invertase Pin-like site-specific DNA recombinase
MAIYGYARVSTQDQSEKYGLDIQKSELMANGVPEQQIFSDVESGAVKDRPQLVKLLDTVTIGDTIIISKLDRLARSMLHLLQIIEQLNEKGVKFKSIHDSGIDTTTPSGKLFLGIMASIAEFERAIIKERTKKGIHAKIAKDGRASWGKKGVSEKKIATAKELLLQGKTHAEVAEILSMPKSTIYKHLPSSKIEQWRDEAIAERNKDNHDIFEK